MAYNSNIPQPNDLLNASQDDLLQNFLSLKAAIDVNHGTFGAADEGKHKWASIPANQNPASPIPIATDMIVLCNNARYTNTPEAIYKRGGANPTFPFTVKKQNLNALSGGWATLGGNNVIIKWGLTQGTGFNLFAFPEAADIPVFSANPYHMTVSPFVPLGFNSNLFARLVGIISPTVFSVKCTQRTTNLDANCFFFWIAIGPT